MAAVSKILKMQNIDEIRQIHNEEVIKMQIACLLALPWCTAQDRTSEPAVSCSCPRAVCCLWVDSKMGLAQGRAELPGVLHTLEPRPAWDFRRELLGVRCILGEQPEAEMFDKSVKLDRRSHEIHLCEVQSKEVQRQDEKKILTIQAAPGCSDQAWRKVSLVWLEKS